MGDHSSNLWHFIPLSEFLRPPEPARETVRKGIRGIINQFRNDSKSGDEFSVRQNLSAVTIPMLARVASLPQWEDSQQALTEIIQTWAEESPPSSPIRVVVGAPYDGTPEMLRNWSREKEWRLVEAPTPKQILNGGEAWLEQFAHNQDMPLVVPRLERLYLRHHQGLSLVRQFLDWLWQRKAHCLIGIDSWAWTYLSKSIGIDALVPQPLTLAPFGAAEFQTWLRELAEGSERLGFVFRQSDNGKIVLPGAGSKLDPGSVQSEYLKYLAAFSRGNPGVGWHIWRHSLEYEADENVEEKAVAIAEQGQGRVMWVRSWSNLNLPVLTGPVGGAGYQLFHTLLLHAGLPAQIAARILPIEFGEVLQHLQRFQSLGLINQVEDRWRVAALGYPAVRSALAREGYLVDKL